MTIRNRSRAAIVGLMIGCFTLAAAPWIGPSRAGDETAADQADLAKQLIGAWVLVGTPGNVGEPPASGGRLKFFTGRHWNITQADPKTGEVIFHHGGTYKLDGDQYVETIEYANPSTKELINKKLKFKVKIDGDTYTQVGDGNPFTEVWKRQK